MKLLFLIVLFYLQSFAKIDYYIDRDTTVNSNIIWQIGVSMGFSTVSSENLFYKDYEKIFLRNAESFDPNILAEVSVKIFLSQYLRLDANVGYFQSKFLDNYFEPFNQNTNSGRFLSQNLVFDEIPILADFELIPFRKSQFRTYIGVGTGVNISFFKWEETVFSEASQDPRKSGVRFSERQFSPIFRGILGTELNFDKFGKNKLLGGITIEANFNYILRSYDVFSGYEPISEYLLTENNNLLERYRLNNLSLQLKIGLSFNFYKKIGKSNGKKRNVQTL